MAITKKLHKRSGVVFYYIRFTKQDGRRKSEKAGTERRQARRLLAKRMGEVASGTYIDPREATDGLTFSEFADRFMKDYGDRCRSNHYTQNMALFKDYFGERQLGEITRAHLDQFRRWDERRAIPGKKSPGPSTVRKHLTMLGTMFRKAVRWGVLQHNPATDLDKPSQPKPRDRHLSREQFQVLRDAAPPWLRPIYRLAVVTGFRLKELVGLRWDLVDQEAGLLHVPEDNKTDTPRAVPLGEVAREVLAGQVRRVRSPYVFLDAAGEPYTSELARQRIVQATIRLMRSSGIEGRSFHGLRHTAGSWAAQAGHSGVEIAQFLGHASGSMTDRYTHLRPDHLRPLVASLDIAEKTSATATQSATQTEIGRESVHTYQNTAGSSAS